MLAVSRLLSRRCVGGGRHKSRWLSSASEGFTKPKIVAGSEPVDYVSEPGDPLPPTAHVRPPDKKIGKKPKKKSQSNLTAIGVNPVRHKTRHDGHIPSESRERAFPAKIEIPFLEFRDQHGNTLKVDSFWLRDHCQCIQCVNQDTMQRNFETFSLPVDDPGVATNDTDCLRVQWKDGHISEYQWAWIGSNYLGSLGQKPPQPPETPLPKKIPFGAVWSTSPPSVDYDDVMSSDAGVGQWTRKIAEFGFCYVNDCPVSPEKTQELLERIANIRVTHYGGFYDFTADLRMKDTAYTNQALSAHTDNAYFTEPSRLQMFHLLSHTDGDGGASLLVDGYKCTEELRNLSPSAYEALRGYNLRWHASGNDGIAITSWKKAPVIAGPLDSSRGVMQIRWNNADRATLRYNMREMSTYKVSEWYDSARLLDSIIKDPKNEYWEQLKPGRPLIFDNWRVLHGRSAFTGKRRICGGYINHDDFHSRYLNTNFPRDAVLRRYI